MLDFIIVLGSGAFSLGLMEKLIKADTKDYFARICRWIELSFVNFAGVYLILRAFGKALIVETAYCNYISIGFISMTVYILVSILTGFVFAFWISKVRVSAVCVKNEEKKDDEK